jgi:hypothetical protein
MNSLVQLSCVCLILVVSAGLFRYDLEVPTCTDYLPPAPVRPDCRVRRHIETPSSFRKRRSSSGRDGCGCAFFRSSCCDHSQT